MRKAGEDRRERQREGSALARHTGHVPLCQDHVHECARRNTASDAAAAPLRRNATTAEYRDDRLRCPRVLQLHLGSEISGAKLGSLLNHDLTKLNPIETELDSVKVVMKKNREMQHCSHHWELIDPKMTVIEFYLNVNCELLNISAIVRN